MSGLIEAAQTLARIDRPAEARDARLAPTTSPEHKGTGEPAPSAPALPDEPVRRHPHPPGGSSGDEARSFDAVIVLVDPRDPDWVTTSDWDALVTPDGLLAFITHSDNRGEFTDPGELLTDTASRSGLNLLDRVILLEVPLRYSTPHLREPAQVARGGSPRPVRIHSDLLLFIRPARPLQNAGRGQR